MERSTRIVEEGLSLGNEAWFGASQDFQRRHRSLQVFGRRSVRPRMNSPLALRVHDVA